MAPTYHGAMADENATPLLTITPEAHAKVLEVRAGEAEPESLALWVEVDGEQNGAFTYLMEFRSPASSATTCRCSTTTTSRSPSPPTSVDKLRGATLELERWRHGDAEPEPAGDRVAVLGARSAPAGARPQR